MCLPRRLSVQLQVIYYETSGEEYMQGGDKCFADPDDTADDTDTADVNEKARAMLQAACTSDEIEDGDSFVLNAESDVDAGEAKRQLVLYETGRFTGIFQGELQVTDPDGDGRGTGSARKNWGLMKKSGRYIEDLATTALLRRRKQRGLACYRHLQRPDNDQLQGHRRQEQVVRNRHRYRAADHQRRLADSQGS